MPNVNYVREEVVKARKIWELIDDCVAGEQQIKLKTQDYLPMPVSESDTDQMFSRYASYLKRAMFYNVTARTLDGLVGQVFSKDQKIDLPENVNRYVDNIDGAGTSLEQQSKLALQTILGKGHGGLLADFPNNQGFVSLAEIESNLIRPRILNIAPEDIINWRMQTIGGESLLSLLVIQEEKIVEDDGFEFDKEYRWRVFRLLGNNGIYQVEVALWKAPGEEFETTDDFYIEEGPSIMTDYRGSPLQRIPFEFMGSTNNEPVIDKAPMLDLANMNIAHYRNSADYEESLFLVGQPTLVISGLTQDWADKNINGKVILGSRSAVTLPKDARAEMLQPHPNIMPKEGMVHKEEQMKAIGAKLIEPNFSKVTATEVLMEAASQSSILTSTANNVSAAYEKVLYHMGMFVSETNFADINFALNTDYTVTSMSAQDRQQLIAEWQGGLITWEEAREGLRTAGIATEENEVARTKVETMDANLI